MNSANDNRGGRIRHKRASKPLGAVTLVLWLLVGDRARGMVRIENA